jgi:hypothetical protein
MLQESKNFIKSKFNLVIISRRICDTDKSEVKYVAKDLWGKEIRGCRVYHRNTPLSLLIETISADLQAVL